MRDHGFIWIPILIAVAVLAFGIHQLVHHNEPNSDHVVQPAAMGCTERPCSASPVPEPGSLILLGAGGLLVGWAVRRRYDP